MCAHFHYIALELQFFDVTLPEIHVHLTHAMCCDIIILLSKDFERSTHGTVTNPRLLMEILFFCNIQNEGGRGSHSGKAPRATEIKKRKMTCMSKAQ